MATQGKQEPRQSKQLGAVLYAAHLNKKQQCFAKIVGIGKKVAGAGFRFSLVRITGGEPLLTAAETARGATRKIVAQLPAF